MPKIISVLIWIFLATCLTLESRANPDDMNFLFQNSSNQQTQTTVQNVISADTIVIEDYARNGKRIKLIGLKAPSIARKKKVTPDRDKNGFVIDPRVDPMDSLEEQSLAFAQRLLSGKKIRLEYDVSTKGPNFETLAYVFLEDEKIFANTEILRQGFADLQLTPQNTKYNDELRAAYLEARQNQRGLQGR